MAPVAFVQTAWPSEARRAVTEPPLAEITHPPRATTGALGCPIGTLHAVLPSAPSSACSVSPVTTKILPPSAAGG
jgi:hypothetical protein